MKKIFFFLALIFFAANTFGQINMHSHNLPVHQNQLTGNISSNTMYTIKSKPAKTGFENIKSGSVFFKDDWMPAKVKLINGEAYENVRVKINLFHNTLHFLLNDTDFIAESSVLEIFMIDTINKETIRFVHSNKLRKKLFSLEDGWYQLLAEGKGSLYKRIEKKLESSREYGSATTVYTIETTEKYLLLYQDQFHVIGKWKDVEKIFSNDNSLLSKIDDVRKANRKFPEGLINVLEFYNLQQK